MEFYGIFNNRQKKSFQGLILFSKANLMSLNTFQRLFKKFTYFLDMGLHFEVIRRLKMSYFGSLAITIENDR